MRPMSDAMVASLALGAGALLAAPVELVLSAVGLHVLLWLLRAERRDFKTTLTAIGMSRSVQLLAAPLLVLSSHVLYVEMLDGIAYLTADDPVHEVSSFGPFELGRNELFVLGGLSFLDDLTTIDWSRIGSTFGDRPMLPTAAASELELQLEKCLAGWTPPQ